MTYRNKTDLRLTIPNVGVVEPHGTIQSATVIENQNLELIDDGGQAPQEPENQQSSEQTEQTEGGTE